MIDNLPDELKVATCLFLNKKSLGRLARTSKDWKSITEDKIFWHSQLAAQSQYKHGVKSAISILAKIEQLEKSSHEEFLNAAKDDLEIALLILQTR